MKKRCFCCGMAAWLPLLLLLACGQQAQKETQNPDAKTIGHIERLSPEMDAIVAPGAAIEVLAEGYNWSEGPLWIADGGYLLFTDVPENTIFKWKEGAGASTYLKPSGFVGEKTESREPGANGLALDAQGRLILCQHGNRQVARMAATLDNPKPVFETLADKWDGKRFNSPNDLCLDRQGNIYFTDPPYGLPQQADDPSKEIPFQGVYRIQPDGTVQLLVDSLSRPNGIALSPDEKTLYVANSDPARALWMAYDLAGDGSLANGRVFYDATPHVRSGMRGLPDGLKTNRDGILFATGPGGVWVFKPDGTPLGRIAPGEATANCALDSDGKYLYMTADMYLCRVKLGGESGD